MEDMKHLPYLQELVTALNEKKDEFQELLAEVPPAISETQRNAGRQCQVGI